MQFRSLLMTLASLGLLAPLTWAGESQGLSVGDFERIHKDLQSRKEAWQAIPWHLSLLEARAQAAKEKKPIYMLARAGHPLGCV